MVLGFGGHGRRRYASCVYETCRKTERVRGKRLLTRSQLLELSVSVLKECAMLSN